MNRKPVQGVFRPETQEPQATEKKGACQQRSMTGDRRSLAAGLPDGVLRQFQPMSIFRVAE